MTKYSFLNDYSEGCHPQIMAKLAATNLVQQTPYGFDEYSLEAKDLIRQKMQNSDADVYFVAGGTQANLIVAAASLRAHEAVVAVDIGHIVGLESGAIEATGHKIVTLKTADNKLSPPDIQRALDQQAFAPHKAQPKLVYISNATEVGTVYTKAELTALYQFCQANDLYLFMDGARLGAALCSHKSDLTFPDLAKLTDILYIGGTKNGALIGEAIVINNPSIKVGFNILIKQRGGLMSKGRLVGVQFLELFRDDLYLEIATYANAQARRIAEAILENGYGLSADIETNQIFAILPNTLIEKLEESFIFYVWQKVDAHTSKVRLVTSWATDEAQVTKFIDMIQ